MAIAGTEKALTVDADVVFHYFLFTSGKPLPNGLKVSRIRDFCTCIIDNLPIAINDFIKTQYEELLGLELVRLWLHERVKNNKAITVCRKPLARGIRFCLRDDYGFDITSRDRWYLETCFNTIFKHLITENTEHFKRPHQSKGRKTMCQFLENKLNILVYTIDECCINLLDEPR